MYKHYITINEIKTVLDSFREDEKQPLKTDILLCENDNRQFKIQPIDVFTGFHISKYIDGEIVEIPEPERGTEATRKVIEQLKVDNKKLALYTESNRLLAKSVYEIMNQGKPVTPETLGDGVRKVARIKDEKQA